MSPEEKQKYDVSKNAIVSHNSNVHNNIELLCQTNHLPELLSVPPRCIFPKNFDLPKVRVTPPTGQAFANLLQIKASEENTNEHPRSKATTKKPPASKKRKNSKHLGTPPTKKKRTILIYVLVLQMQRKNKKTPKT